MLTNQQITSITIASIVSMAAVACVAIPSRIRRSVIDMNKVKKSIRDRYVPAHQVSLTDATKEELVTAIHEGIRLDIKNLYPEASWDELNRYNDKQLEENLKKAK